MRNWVSAILVQVMVPCPLIVRILVSLSSMRFFILMVTWAVSDAPDLSSTLRVRVSWGFVSWSRLSVFLTRISPSSSSMLYFPLSFPLME